MLQKPSESSKIVEKYGYEPPKNKQELAQAVRLLVKKKGEPVIKDLMAIHPEKQLILEVTGHKSDESNYCGCHSAYTGETKELLDQLSTMSVNDLTNIYEDTKKKSKEKPEDKSLMAEVETVWDELRRRKKQKDKEEKNQQESMQSSWMKLGLAFLAGIVISKIA